MQIMQENSPIFPKLTSQTPLNFGSMLSDRCKSRRSRSEKLISFDTCCFFCTILLMDNDLKNKTMEDLEDMVESFGQKKYLARYIFTLIHSKDTRKISDITSLSKPFRRLLAEKGCCISRLKTLRKLTDTDRTVKYLFQLKDGLKIESVLMQDGKRKTLTY